MNETEKELETRNSKPETSDYAWLRLLKLAKQKAHEREEFRQQRMARRIAAQKHSREDTRNLFLTLKAQIRQRVRRQTDLARKFDSAITAANVPEVVRRVLRRDARIKQFAATTPPYCDESGRLIRPAPDQLVLGVANAPGLCEISFYRETILAALRAAGVELKTLKFVGA